MTEANTERFRSYYTPTGSSPLDNHMIILNFERKIKKNPNFLKKKSSFTYFSLNLPHDIYLVVVILTVLLPHVLLNKST